MTWRRFMDRIRSGNLRLLAESMSVKAALASEKT